MKFIPYVYHGPQSSVTVRFTGPDSAEQEKDIMLYPGLSVELPSEHEYTQTLIAQKLLTPLAPVAKTVKGEAKTKEQKDDGR